MSRIGRLPGIRLGRFAAGAGEDFVELLHRRGVELDLGGADRAGELLERARSDDRGGDDGVVQQPRQADVGGLLAELFAEAFVRFELLALRFDLLLRAFAAAPALRLLLKHAAEHSARERAPWDQSESVMP